MNRVNVVIVKMLVFCVLFGGMLLGVTTRASANPAGCTGGGHLSCGYDTTSNCEAMDKLECTATKLERGHGPFSGNLDCDGDGVCHHVVGKWIDYDCTIECHYPLPIGTTITKSIVGKSWIVSTG